MLGQTHQSPLAAYALRVPLALLCFGVALAGMISLPTTRAQQGSDTAFIYDDNGRLQAVIAPSGEASVYDYDAAGNFTGLRRLDANAFEVLTFTPREGPPGLRVTIYGVGFGAGITSVSFNGANATILSSNNISVVAEVPANATTGPITVVSPRGTRATLRPFMVQGVFVQPSAVTLSAEASQQFTADVFGLQDTSVTWSVNGLNGGNSQSGTITTTGFYSAPFVFGTTPGSFLVRATSVTNPAFFGDAVVTVQPTAGVTVSYTGPPVIIPENNPTGVNISLVVSGVQGNITDLNFRIDSLAGCNASVGNVNAGVDHTYVGDLIFKLTSPSGTTVTIIDRPGVPPSSTGFGGNNFCATTLNDEGGFPPIETVSTEPVSGSFSPNNPLSAFDGQNANGTWVLNVSDVFAQDVGSVRRFSLIIFGTGGSLPPLASLPLFTPPSGKVLPRP
jgi:YD repeat-containing protein